MSMRKFDSNRSYTIRATPHDFLEAENVSLRLLLAQAEIDARSLLAQTGIDAREREASNKLQKLILDRSFRRMRTLVTRMAHLRPVR
jgi:hypothetical protein